MKISDKGVAFIAAHEGVVPGPYLDSVGVWTVYVGHTAAAGAPIPADMPRGMPADLDAALREAFAVFKRDLAKYQADVLRVMGNTPMEQHEFDAACSFHYNSGAIARAAWVDLWKRGQKADAARSMLANWRKPAEIIGRRTAERDLFLTGSYGADKATVWQVNMAGKIVWKQARRLSQDDILRLMAEVSPTAGYPTLKRGDKGEMVKRAQVLLLEAGFDPNGLDGVFGPGTEKAAIAWQKSVGLVADGIIGPASWPKLMEQ
ncbi:lysozyme [Paracoccus yeei]|uniref:Lysozyme n=1 Tax=Paracoccus yeei TaxID=147645 RepID=A0A1V0GVV2_9RHOB|nr:peptidoglycan-binding protein [Paracoccus yeei]ARC37920.1 lysozyme [Paracoccus yeei]